MRQHRPGQRPGQGEVATRRPKTKARAGRAGGLPSRALAALTWRRVTREPKEEALEAGRGETWRGARPRGSRLQKWPTLSLGKEIIGVTDHRRCVRADETPREGKIGYEKRG